MTLYEVELLMQGLTKFIPENAHLLFGAATDQQMNDTLSVTIISALPEERLQAVPFVEKIEVEDEPVLEEVVREDVSTAIEAVAEFEEDSEAEIKDTVLSLVENEPEGLEDEEPEEIEEIEDEVEEESVVAEEDIEFELDDLDDFAAPGLKVISDEEELEPKAVSAPEPVKEPEPELEIEEFVSAKSLDNQGELLLEGAPKGRFDGESPNVVKDGEDLDIPPYLRKRSRRR